MCDHGQVDTSPPSRHSTPSHLILPSIADTDMMFDATEIIRMNGCSAVKEVGRHRQIRASRVLAAFRSAARCLAGTRRLVESFEQESLPALERHFEVQFPQNSFFKIDTTCKSLLSCFCPRSEARGQPCLAFMLQRRALTSSKWSPRCESCLNISATHDKKEQTKNGKMSK